MMYIDYGDEGGGGGGGGGGTIDPTINGGTNPSQPPGWHPIGGNGLWVYISGVWRWMWDPVQQQNKVP
jgi:hypothetical protein